MSSEHTILITMPYPSILLNVLLKESENEIIRAELMINRKKEMEVRVRRLESVKNDHSLSDESLGK